MSRKNRRNAEQSKNEQPAEKPADVQNEQGTETAVNQDTFEAGREESERAKQAETSTAETTDRQPTEEEVASADQPIKPDEVAVEGENRPLTDDELRDLSAQTGLPIEGRPDLSASQPPVESTSSTAAAAEQSVVRDRRSEFDTKFYETYRSLEEGGFSEDEIREMMYGGRTLEDLDRLRGLKKNPPAGRTVESPDPHGSRDQNQPFSDEANNDKPDDGGIPKSEPADVIAARNAADFDIEALEAVERSLSGRANQTAEGKEALIHVRYALDMLRSEQKQAE